MALRFLLDENCRGLIWDAVRSYNAKGIAPIDVVRVGDPPDLPCGTLDPNVLLWAEHEDRILVSYDRKTMPGHLNDHLRQGRRSPGVLLVRGSVPVSQVVAHIAILAHASDPWEWTDRCDFIP